MSPLKLRLRRLYAWWLRHTPRTARSICGSGHRLDWADAMLFKCPVTVSGKNNCIEIAPGARLWNTRLELNGTNLHVRIGADVRLRGATLILTHDGSRIHIGKNTTMTGPLLAAQGGGGISVGEDCMVAYGSDLRCCDGHSVIDVATGATINPTTDITVGDHVWIGLHCQLLKGITIGPHAIVAARSVVTRDVPAHTLVAGSPAKPIRTGITWARPCPPRA